MTVATFLQNNFTAQTPPSYKASLDGNMAVLANIAQQFAPHAASTPNMTVLVDAGSLFLSGAPVTQAQQTTPAFTAPTANSRIDRVVVNATTGAVSVVTGTQATSPTAPTIPAGFMPVCQVLLTSTTTAITNTMITDERTLNNFDAIANEIARAQGAESALASAVSNETTRATNTEAALASSKQNNLGFTPVQQGGGIGQGANKIYLGWDAPNAHLRLQVDSTDFGSLAKLSDVLGNPAQSWQNVTASRAVNTNYTNSTNSPIAVSIISNVSNGVSNLIIGGIVVSSSTTLTGYSNPETNFAIVPVGVMYSATGSFSQWNELR